MSTAVAASENDGHEHAQRFARAGSDCGGVAPSASAASFGGLGAFADDFGVLAPCTARRRRTDLPRRTQLGDFAPRQRALVFQRAANLFSSSRVTPRVDETLGARREVLRAA